MGRVDWTASVQHGYDGLLLLVDELSLFLAGKSPSRREGMRPFCNFSPAGPVRAPVWLIGALQRNLADVGALRTHSWRQVEDRFQRYTLSPQEIGRILRDKLVQRIDAPAIRQMIAARHCPRGGSSRPHHPRRGACSRIGRFTHRPLTCSWRWPTATCPRIAARWRSCSSSGSPVGSSGAAIASSPRWISFSLVADDLLCDESLERLWHVVNLLADLDAIRAGPTVDAPTARFAQPAPSGGAHGAGRTTARVAFRRRVCAHAGGGIPRVASFAPLWRLSGRDARCRPRRGGISPGDR